MAEMSSGPPLDPRLRDYLDAELRRAERDFPHLARLEGRRSRGGRPLTMLVAAAVVLLVAVLAGSQLLGRWSTGPAAVQMGADGLPISIDGQPVLRLSDVVPTPVSARSFLVGGTLILASDPCPDLSGPSPIPCDESWRFKDSAGAIGINLVDIAGAPGFVRTTGAPTVVRASATPPCDHCAGSYEVEAVVWRQPTKGPIPPDASLPQGGSVFDALVPDYVSMENRDATAIVGYIPKSYVIGEGLSGFLLNPPPSAPIPVYGDDLTTLVGNVVANVGFVALGATAPPVNPGVSVAPSPAPPTPLIASPGPSAFQSGPFTWYPADAAKLGGASLDAVTPMADGRLLGIGRPLLTAPAGDGSPSSTFWVSAGGLAWARLPGSSPLVASTAGWSAVALDVARVGSGYVAVGMDQAGDASSANASAWYSADGVHWTRAAVDDGTGRTMNQLVVTKDGLVSLGEAGYTFHAGFGAGTALWTSPDGRAWTRLPDAAAPPRGTRVSGVVAVAGGYLATAAFEASLGYLASPSPQPPVTAGIWRSADAVHWQAVAGTPLGMGAIAVTPGELIGVGSGQAFNRALALAWHSANGTVWASTPLPTPPGVPAGTVVGALTVVGAVGGLLAIGERRDDTAAAGATSTMLAWSSPDGTAWAANDLPVPRGTVFDRAFAVDGAVLVVGEAQPDTGSVPDMWLVSGIARSTNP